MHKIYDPRRINTHEQYYLITSDVGATYTATELTIDQLTNRRFTNEIVLVENHMYQTKSFYIVNEKANPKFPLHGTLHRINGPAQIDEVGTEFWYKEGELHRLNGPCIDYTNSRHLHNDPNDAVDCYDVSESTEPYLKMFFQERYKKEIELYTESYRQTA